MSGEYSHKKNSRVRTPDGVKALPDDLHHELSELKTLLGYDSLWQEIVAAAREGTKIQRAKENRASEIIHGIGNSGNALNIGGRAR